MFLHVAGCELQLEFFAPLVFEHLRSSLHLKHQGMKGDT
jgi:hypothetical protein